MSDKWLTYYKQTCGAVLKGTVHPQMKIQSLLTHPQSDRTSGEVFVVPGRCVSSTEKVHLNSRQSCFLLFKIWTSSENFATLSAVFGVWLSCCQVFSAIPEHFFESPWFFSLSSALSSSCLYTRLSRSTTSQACLILSAPVWQCRLA